jgi:UDP-2,3-diacylglucosamine pyrophosphatase LpxH
MDAVAISDLHLGSRVCQHRKLAHFFYNQRLMKPRYVIINGDIVEDLDFRRWPWSHWFILSQIRKLARRSTVVLVAGNHDGPAYRLALLLGLDVVSEFVLASGGRTILFTHGNRFDRFLDVHPTLTAIGDWIYLWLARLDPSFRLARAAKRTSKTFLHCSAMIRRAAIDYAREKGVNAVCCGHTHFAVTDETGPIAYYNSGCWTELPCTYLAVTDGRVQLQTY